MIRVLHYCDCGKYTFKMVIGKISECCPWCGKKYMTTYEDGSLVTNVIKRCLFLHDWKLHDVDDTQRKYRCKRCGKIKIKVFKFNKVESS